MNHRESLQKTSAYAGMSLIEVLIAVAIISIVFVGLFTVFQTLATLGTQNRLHSHALFLANEHVEKIRAMPYDSIGTVFGLPSGTIPQSETITYNGHKYTRKTFIQYVDDPADGLDLADSLTADYKRVKVLLEYDYHGETQSYSFVTTIAPKSMESLVGAGVLRINVTDSDNQPVFQSMVHVFNNSIATTVDITTLTNASGTVSFPGAWEGGGYEVYVSKNGYSSAQTYTSTTTNPNPSPSPLNVVENDITEIFFKIDPLSSIVLHTQSLPTRNRYLDDFADTAGLAEVTDVEVVSDTLVLTNTLGIYTLAGSATTSDITPASLGEWLLLSADTTQPASTEVRLRIMFDTGGGVFMPVPDTDLPGNSAGFTNFPIDLHSLNVSSYPSLRVALSLTTSDQNVTPSVQSLKISYHEEISGVPNVSIDIVGSKTIGTDVSSSPIYKYDETIQTSATGTWASGLIDSDVYTLTVHGYKVAEACPTIPIVLDPGTDLTSILTLTANTTNNLFVQVVDTIGNPIPRAEVHLTGGLIDETQSTSSCGGTYFSSLTADTYTIEIDAPGHTHTTDTVLVSGETLHVATMP